MERVEAFCSSIIVFEEPRLGSRSPSVKVDLKGLRAGDLPLNPTFKAQDSPPPCKALSRQKRGRMMWYCPQ